VSLAPVTQSMQRDFERLAAENLQLKKQVEQLQDLLGRRATNVAAAPPSGAASLPVASAPRNNSPAAALNVSPAPRAAVAAPPDPPPAPRMKTYTVQKGDTPTVIARKFNVKLDALLAANPKLDPRRMQIGQTLNIPAP
ncbi:MAG TPA: LysM domain-containing protein, partial [Verrucomicrobiae bacterium]